MDYPLLHEQGRAMALCSECWSSPCRCAWLQAGRSVRADRENEERHASRTPSARNATSPSTSRTDQSGISRSPDGRSPARRA